MSEFTRKDKLNSLWEGNSCKIMFLKYLLWVLKHSSFEVKKAQFHHIINIYIYYIATPVMSICYYSNLVCRRGDPLLVEIS